MQPRAYPGVGQARYSGFLRSYENSFLSAKAYGERQDRRTTTRLTNTGTDMVMCLRKRTETGRPEEKNAA